MKKAPIDAQELLHTKSLKATPIRLRIIETLHESKTPLTIEELQKILKKKGGNTTTLYRALSAFVENHIAQATPITKGVYSYELIWHKHHHHHIVCNDCGIIESIPFCIKNIGLSASKKSRLFKTIQSHSLSFFGTCKKCIKKVR